MQTTKRRKIKNQQKVRFPDILNVLFSLQCTLTSWFFCFTLRRGSWVLLFSPFGLSLASPAVRMHVLRSFSHTMLLPWPRTSNAYIFLEQRSRYRTHASRIKEAERPLSRGVLCMCVYGVHESCAIMWYRQSDLINHLGA